MRMVAIAVMIGAAVGLFLGVLGARGETIDRLVSVCRTEAAVSAKQPMWAWRMIDGRKCWYAGARMRDRGTLFWAPPEPERVVEPVPAPVIVEPPHEVETVGRAWLLEERWWPSPR